MVGTGGPGRNVSWHSLKTSGDNASSTLKSEHRPLKPIVNTIRLPKNESTTSSRSRDGFELFLISLIILFLELAAIRWFPAHVLYLTFFTNVVLLASFLGMSVGCLAASRRRDYLTWTPLLLVLVFLCQWRAICTHINAATTARQLALPADAVQLMNALHLETPFNVQNGILHGIDIEKAATSLITKGATGGETRFDHLSGHLVRDRGAHKFTDLKISSGALAADGAVNISAKQELSGRVNAQVKAVGTSANIPLNVAGTVHSPLLYPTGGTMACWLRASVPV